MRRAWEFGEVSFLLLAVEGGGRLQGEGLARRRPQGLRGPGRRGAGLVLVQPARVPRPERAGPSAPSTARRSGCAWRLWEPVLFGLSVFFTVLVLDWMREGWLPLKTAVATTFWSAVARGARGLLRRALDDARQGPSSSRLLAALGRPRAVALPPRPRPALAQSRRLPPRPQRDPARLPRRRVRDRSCPRALDDRLLRPELPDDRMDARLRRDRPARPLRDERGAGVVLGFLFAVARELDRARRSAYLPRPDAEGSPQSRALCLTTSTRSATT